MLCLPRCQLQDLHVQISWLRLPKEHGAALWTCLPTFVALFRWVRSSQWWKPGHESTQCSPCLLWSLWPCSLCRWLAFWHLHVEASSFPSWLSSYLKVNDSYESSLSKFLLCFCRHSPDGCQSYSGWGPLHRWMRVARSEYALCHCVVQRLSRPQSFDVGQTESRPGQHGRRPQWNDS